jgi:uncharacterized protein (TIGR00255 family)
MLYSMTGFATTHLEWHVHGKLIPITISIKSLNSRFFETICRMPHVLAPLEQTIVQRCKKALKRGNITITVHIGSTCALYTLAIPTSETLTKYVQALRAIKEECHLAGDVTLGDLIRLPQLFESVEIPLPEALTVSFLEALDTLLHEVLTHRQREGTALYQDLVAAMHTIYDCIQEIEPRAQVISQERRERFLEVVAQSLATASPDLKQQHIQALYQQVPSIDVHEEIVRIRAHHQEFLKTLDDTDVQKGKKLDFILQELFREINTLGAKLADARSIGSILTIKTKLEQAREQVQNIV